MSRTITALFDSRADAEAGGERLREAGIDATHIRVHDQASHSTAGANSTRDDPGMWASIKNVFLPDADRHAYEEGVRRGGFLLTANIDDDATPAAIGALENVKGVDLDERSAQWRSEGWNVPAAAADASGDGSYGYRNSDDSGPGYRSYSPDERR